MKERDENERKKGRKKYVGRCRMKDEEKSTKERM